MPDEYGSMNMDDIMKLADRLSASTAQQEQQRPMQRSTSTIGILGQMLGGGPSGAVNMSEEQQIHQARRAMIAWGGAMARGGSWSPYGARNLMDIMGEANAAGWGASEDYERGLMAQAKDAREQRRLDLVDRQNSLQQAMKLAEMQQSLRQLNLTEANRRRLMGGDTSVAGGGGGGTNTRIGSVGDGSQFTGDLEHDRQVIVRQESGGDPKAMNYIAKADPSAWDRGATATGKYQFVTGTWKEGLKLAGYDPGQYARAMDAPEEVQDKVFEAIYKQRGSAPWDKSKWRKDWIRDEQGNYQLATVHPDQKEGPTSPAAPVRTQVASRATGTATDATPAPVPPDTSAAPAAPSAPAAPTAITPMAPQQATAIAGATKKPIPVANPDGSPSGLHAIPKPDGTVTIGTLGGGFVPGQTPASAAPAAVPTPPAQTALQAPPQAPTGATPGAVAPLAPATPAPPGQAPAPGQGQAALPVYTRPHAFEPTLAVPPDDPRFSTQLDPKTDKEFNDRLAANRAQMRQRVAYAPADQLEKIETEHSKIEQDILRERQQARDKVLERQGTAVSGWQKEERDRQYEEWKTQTYPAEPSDLAAAGIEPQPGVIYRVDNRGKITQEKVEVDPRLVHIAEGDLKTFKEQYETPYIQIQKMRPLMDQMDYLRQKIMKNGGAPSGIAGDYLRKLQGMAASVGFASNDWFNKSDAEVLNSIASQAVLAMKAGVSLGNTSNMDLELVGSQIPTMTQSLEGQEKLSKALKQIWNHQERIYKLANEEIRSPKSQYTLGKLQERIENEGGSAIPRLPPDAQEWDAKQVKEWRDKHRLEKGMVFFMPDGQIATVMK